jgi:hypothetical protein
MAHYFKDKRGYLTLLGLIITLAFICFLFYTLINTYFKKLPIDKSLQGQGGILSSQGIDATNYQSVTKSTRKKIEGINKQHREELENLQKQLGQ